MKQKTQHSPRDTHAFYHLYPIIFLSLILCVGVQLNAFAAQAETHEKTKSTSSKSKGKKSVEESQVATNKGVDPFESIRHLRPKPDKAAPKFPWTPDRKYLTDSEYALAQEHIKYWNEYYHDCFKPMYDLKKDKKNFPTKTLPARWIMLEKGIRVEKHLVSRENMDGIDYRSLDGSLLPGDKVGIDLLLDLSEWEAPKWQIKQEILKKYPLAKLKKMNRRTLAKIVWDLRDRLYPKRGYQQRLFELALPHFRKTGFVDKDFISMSQRVADLNIPFVSPEVAAQAASLAWGHGRAADDFDGLRLAWEKGKELPYRHHKPEENWELEACSQSIVGAIIFFSKRTDVYKNASGGFTRRWNEYSENYAWQGCEMSKKYAGKTEDMNDLYESLRERFKEANTQKIVKKYGDTYTPYANSDLKQAWKDGFATEGSTHYSVMGEVTLVPVSHREAERKSIQAEREKAKAAPARTPAQKRR